MIQPLFDNVLIKPLEVEAKTAAGIIIPDSAKEKPQMGEVMAVGPGKNISTSVDPKIQESFMVVKVGDKVMYKKWGGNEVKIDNIEYILIEQKDILAVIE